MKKILRVLTRAGVHLFAMTAVTAQEALVISEEIAEISPGQALEIEVQIPKRPARHEAVLEFTAWHAAEQPAGFYPSLYVRWNDLGVQTTLDRPTELSFGEGRVLKVRQPEGWAVALLAEPTQTVLSGPYQLSVDEIADFTRYRFILPTLTEGSNRLKISNTLNPKHDDLAYPTLSVSDIRVVFVKD